MFCCVRQHLLGFLRIEGYDKNIIPSKKYLSKKLYLIAVAETVVREICDISGLMVL